MNGAKEWFIRLLVGLLGITTGVIIMAVAVKGDIADNAGELGVARSERLRMEQRIDRLEGNYEKIMDKLSVIAEGLAQHSAETKR